VVLAIADAGPFELSFALDVRLPTARTTSRSRFIRGSHTSRAASLARDATSFVVRSGPDHVSQQEVHHGCSTGDDAPDFAADTTEG